MTWTWSDYDTEKEHTHTHTHTHTKEDRHKQRRTRKRTLKHKEWIEKLKRKKTLNIALVTQYYFTQKYKYV